MAFIAPLRMLAHVCGRVRTGRINGPSAFPGQLHRFPHQLRRDAASPNGLGNARMGNGHYAVSCGVVQFCAMSVNLGGELTRFLVMANGAHCPLVAPLVSGAPRAAEPGEPAAAVSAAAPRVATVEFAPVDGAAQLVRLPGPAELDEPAAAEVDEPAQLPE